MPTRRVLCTRIAHEIRVHSTRRVLDPRFHLFSIGCVAAAGILSASPTFTPLF